MDLSDLASVKAAAQEFLKLEGPDGRLDVLFNNAGTGARKKAPPTRQGHEYHFGTNIIGPFLLARLLSPILSKTAKQSAPGSVRVVWSASLAVDMFSPKGGVRRDFLRDPAATATRMRPFAIYSASKAANWFVAAEFARRQPDGDDENGDDGDGGSGGGAVLHIAGNPGNYNTSIWRHTPALVVWLLRPTLRHPVHGAETNLFMGCSDSVTLADAAAGRYAICDGRWHPAPRKDLLLALRGEEEGGTGQARECFEWCEERVREFLELSGLGR
jgi:NAD(P)-dependent dehydrogenase (short-subunit alcohol dehydrogenase family)